MTDAFAALCGRLLALGVCMLACSSIASSDAIAEGAKPAQSAKSAPSTAQAKPAWNGQDGIVGEWWSEEKDGRIRFYRHRSGTYRAILSWSKKPRADTENDNPKLRSRSIVGIVLMWDLRFDDGEYEDGYVYNPEDGNVYRIDCKVLGPNRLEVRGYLGVALFGQTQVWTRYR